MKLISDIMKPYKLCFGWHVHELPKGWYGIGGMVHSIPVIMKGYTRIVIPINFNNKPNKC